MRTSLRSSELVIAIDQGTSSLKVIAFDLSGHVLAAVAASTEIRLSGHGTMEGRPERWWSHCAAALQAALADPALGAGQGPALPLCGALHTPLAGRFGRPGHDRGPPPSAEQRPPATASTPA